ncbi:uncharacterized protein LOC114365958 [Ostrinia furnacalis]|uniref:uncharacterized protein LOC114365958 n=1 Tax=Ostrinia furnacalis TaxID=93504 RepID=UPI00103E5309|nr:uncharacterized protein LOC114365958 [Ostrinia furnacalis]
MDQFTTTPSSSDVDLLIEKFKVEVTRSIDEASSDTRKLTLTSTFLKPKTSEMSNNIDKQITDLENIIKKLQDEITEMSKNADREVEYTPIMSEDPSRVRQGLSNETIILDNNSDNIEETESVRDAMKGKESKNCFESEQYNHVFPLMIRDVLLPFDGGLTTCEHTINDLRSLDGSEKFLTIKQDVIDVWNGLPDYTPKDNLEVRICELQQEITDQMETLKDNIEESSDQFHDA